MVASMVLMTPALVEASGAKSRSTAERRLKPGQGYFANSPQNRSPTATQSYSRSVPNTGIARANAPSQNIVRTPATRSGAPIVYRYVVRRGAAPGTVVRVPVVQPETVTRPAPQSDEALIKTDDR